MRESKFRARTLDGSWIYTSPQVMFNFGGEFAYLPGRGEGAKVIPLVKGTIGQYAGLQDKNGAEIYEGDIDADRYVMTCVWACFRFRKGRSTKPYTPYRFRDVVSEGVLDLEVIGNIYENPELLEQAS